MSDWEKREKALGQANYKTFCPNGTHENVKLAEVEITDKPTWKSPRMVFKWADDDQYKYPRSIAHWLSLGNPDWRMLHNRNILIAFGIEKKKAEELVDVAEKDQDRAKLVKAYEALYKRLVDRGVATTIVVQDQYRDGQPVVSDKGTVYSESDFVSGGCRMMALLPTESADPLADPLSGSTDLSDEILNDEVPFD